MTLSHRHRHREPDYYCHSCIDRGVESWARNHRALTLVLVFWQFLVVLLVVVVAVVRQLLDQIQFELLIWAVVMILVVLVSDIYHTVDMIRDGVGDDFAKMVVVMG